jgi:hypothetical protein
VPRAAHGVADRLDPRPVLRRREVARHLRERIRPFVDAAVPVGARLVVPVPERFQVSLQVIMKIRLDRGQELRLVVLDGDHTVATARDDRLDDLLRAAHGVDRDERTGQVDRLQERREGGDLVGLGVGGDLEPSAIPSALAQALTMGSAPRSVAVSCDRRQVLPSMATRRWGWSASVGSASLIPAWKPRGNAAGLRATSRRRRPSREGMPLGKARCWASHEARCLAQRGIAVGPAHPPRMPRTAMPARATKRCLRVRVGRGSESDSKDEPREPTSTSWATAVILESVGDGFGAPNQGVRQPADNDRIKESEPRSVAPDHPDHAAMRAGRGAIPARR